MIVWNGWIKRVGKGDWYWLKKDDEDNNAKLLVSSSLFGDEVVEFLLGDDTVTVSIGSLDHFLEDVVVGELSEIFGDFSEVLEGNEAGFLGVEGDEDLVHFVSALVVGGSGGHHVEELGELDLSAAV